MQVVQQVAMLGTGLQCKGGFKMDPEVCVLHMYEVIKTRAQEYSAGKVLLASLTA